jgi:hypothetical protein
MGYDLEVLSSTQFSDIIRWNTDISHIQDNVFLVSSTSAVPEPSTMLLIGTCFVALVGFKRKLQKG